MARKSRVTAPTANHECNKTPYRAAVYLRLSDEDREDMEQNSIGNQKKIALNYLKSHSDISLVEIYADNGFSGMSYDRPDFFRMKGDIEQGKVNCVIVKDISRFGREFILTGEYVEKFFPEHGVRLICINDGYDSIDENSDVSALIMPFKMIMNDNYSRDISKKIRTSIAAKINAGEFLPASGSVPYGYIRNPDEKTYDIDEESGDIVREIFMMRALGMSFSSIARTLNEKNIPSPGKLRLIRGLTTAEKYRDALWIRGTVRKITCDRVYIGERIHGKLKSDKIKGKKERRDENEWMVVENAHPSIVPRELFEKVQDVNRDELEKRSQFKTRTDPGADHRELLRGKIFCADCGRDMTGMKRCAKVGTQTPSGIYYDCREYKYSSGMRCGCHYISQETVMKVLTELLNSQVALSVDVEKLAYQLERIPKVKGHNDLLKQKLATVSSKKRNIESKIEQLIVDLTERIIDREEYEYIKGHYEIQLDGLRTEENRILSDLDKVRSLTAETERWVKAVKKYHRLPEIDRPLLDILVDKIMVHSDRSIEIILNYADPFRPITDYLSEIEAIDNAV